MVGDLKFQINQFEKFYYFLMKEAPKNYTPWFFPCKPKGKNPCPSAILKIDSSSKGSWHHTSARLNKKQVIEHIKQGYNIGLSAREGDALIIIDVDNPDYYKDIPTNTLTAQSRKRMAGHLFYWDKDGSAKINLPTDHGEIRSNNQYVLICGSYVPFNLEDKKDKKAFDELPNKIKEDKLIGYYTILTSEHPKEITFSDVPQFFKDKQEENLEVETKILQTEEKNEYKKEGKYSDLFKLKVSDILGEIPAKKRTGHPLHESDTDANFSLTKDGSLGHCWRHLVSLNAVQYLCVKNGYSKCEDAGTPHKGRGISKIRGDKKAYKIAFDEAVKMGLIKEYKENKNLNEDFTYEVETTNKDGVVKKTKKVDIDKLADFLIEKYTFKTIYGSKSEKVYVYQDGIYIPKGGEIIKTRIEEILNSLSRTNIVNEIFEKIKRKTAIDLVEFNTIEEGVVCLENGVYDLKNYKFLKHNPKFYFKTKLPINYNPKAKCEKIQKFFDETLYEEDVKLLQEWIGYNLYNRYFEKKAIIFFGETDTGKTITLNLLSHFIGEKNKVSLSLQKIAFGKSFDLLDLKDKYSNIYDDLGDQDIKDTGGFKIATGGGFITGEEKFGDRIDFKTHAKLTFATNKIPAVDDVDDDAYYSRWMPVRFDNQIIKEDQDKFLLQKLTAQEEISGMFNWGVRGFKRLRENNCFTFNKTSKEIKEIMQRSSHPLSAFAQDCLVEKEGNKITKQDMFELYSIWCLDKNRARFTKDKLGKNLERFVPYMLSTNTTPRCWLNVNFSDLKVKGDSYYTFFKTYKGKKSSKNMSDNKDNNLGIYNNFKGVPPVPKNPLFTKEKLDQAAPEFREMLEEMEK